MVNVALIYIYYSSFQKVDEEEYGGATEIIKEGLMTSFSSFVVRFIIMSTKGGFHEVGFGHLLFYHFLKNKLKIV